MSAIELAARLRRREITSVQATEDALARIREKNGELGAFVAVDESGAMHQAARADALRAKGIDRPFLGVPVGIKDHEPVRGFVTGLGSRAFRWLYTPFDGAVASAMRDAGCVILGKCSTSELTILPVVDNPTARTPIAPAHYAGGSSGGTAAAVASGMFAFGPGSDGGGSIRIPASFCGIVGVKPGRGALPNPYGSMDPAGISSIGPLARNVRDAAALMDVLAGGGRRYATGVDAPIPSRLRIKILLSTTIARVDPQCAAAAAAIAKQLEAMGHSLAPAAPYIASIDEFLPIMARMVARVPLLPFAERLLEPSTLFLRSWGRQFTNEQVAERAAQLRERVSDWFGDTDVLVTPTVAVLPPKVGAYAGMSGEEKLRACAPLGAFTAPFNISGQPAISIPAARSSSGLPIGVQLVGRPRSERMLLGLAARLGF